MMKNLKLKIELEFLKCFIALDLKQSNLVIKSSFLGNKERAHFAS